MIYPPSIERAEAMVFAIRQINRDPYLLPGVNLRPSIFGKHVTLHSLLWRMPMNICIVGMCQELIRQW